MNKSNLLDELRLEIGLVREQVQTLSSFYIGIIKKFGNFMNDNSSVSIYETKETFFHLKACSGPSYLNTTIPFGESVLSLVAIRGRLVFQVENEMQKLYLPFYKEHHLLGLIVFHLPTKSYQVTEEDFIFIREVGRFIEVQHETFYPSTY
ncbi:hypothetical protein ACFFHM_08740 [Halalkalibacter kiskunsagensis]|uniref:GAF domain-containing protein n=1 Tax=Halalkalibacter kiskunsagensis TaxID=1548599 RepID=A0ABV6KB91_9BACI